MKAKWIFVVGFTFVTTFFGFADPSWRGVANLDIPFPSQVKFDPINTEIIYSVFDGSGIYKSVNSGKTWTSINKGLEQLGMMGSILAIDPKDSQTLYLGTWNNGLFKSIDGGTSWRNILARDGTENCCTILDILIRSDALGTLLVATDSQCVKASFDHGSTWQTEIPDYPFRQLGNLSDGTLVAIDNIAGARSIYALEQSGRGFTYRKLLNKDFSQPLEDVWLAKGQLFAQTGETLMTLSSEMRIQSKLTMPSSLRFKLIKPGLGESVIGISGKDIYVSTNNGKSWEKTNYNKTGREITNLEACGKRLAFSFIGGISVSNDSGVNWSTFEKEFSSNLLIASKCIAKYGKDLYVGTYGSGIYRLLADGTAKKEETSILDSGNINLLFTSPLGLNCVTRSTGSLFRKSGEAWASVTNQLPKVTFSAFAVNPADAREIWLGSETAGVIKSVDAGKTWEHLPIFSGRFIGSIAFDGGPIVITTDTGLYTSIDDGVSWKKELVGKKLFSRVVFEGKEYIGTDAGLYMRNMGAGDRWTQPAVNLSEERIDGFLSVGKALFVKTKSNGVFRFDGTNWTDFSRGLQNRYTTCFYWEGSTSRVLYLGTMDGLQEVTLD